MRSIKLSIIIFLFCYCLISYANEQCKIKRNGQVLIIDDACISLLASKVTNKIDIDHVVDGILGGSQEILAQAKEHAKQKAKDVKLSEKEIEPVKSKLIEQIPNNYHSSLNYIKLQADNDTCNVEKNLSFSLIGISPSTNEGVEYANIALKSPLYPYIITRLTNEPNSFFSASHYIYQNGNMIAGLVSIDEGTIGGLMNGESYTSTEHTKGNIPIVNIPCS